MASKTTTLTLLSLITTLATAQQSTTLHLPFYGYDQQPIVASVIAANPSATVLTLACKPGTDGSDCGLFPMQTLTVGPSTYHMDTGAGAGFMGTQDCSTQGSTAAVCKESAGGSEANDPGSSTTTYSGDGVGVMPVVVTAGVDRLGGSGSAPASASASATGTSSGEVTMLTGTATASSASQSGSGSSGSATGSATESAAATSSSSATAVDPKVSGGLYSLFVATASMFGLWLF